MKQTEASWLAALIDGEGCIYVYKPPHNKVEVSITNNETILLRKVLAVTKCGNIHRDGERSYKWRIGNRIDVARVLKKVLPYLVIKGTKAIRALEVISS